MSDAGGWRGNYVTPAKADTFVTAYRRWFDGAGPPPYQPHAVDYFRQAPLSKEALLDRHSQHTAHCTSCAGALRCAKRVAAVADALLLAAVAMLGVKRE